MENIKYRANVVDRQPHFVQYGLGLRTPKILDTKLTEWVIESLSHSIVNTIQIAGVSELSLEIHSQMQEDEMLIYSIAHM